MCLILFAHGSHSRYRLVIAANRDEFYDRPSEQARFWEEAPGLLAGRDLREGGTWMGITRTGRIGALTNYRDPAAHRPAAPSRGGIVPRFLRGSQAPEDFLESLLMEKPPYNGFNLLAGDRGGVCWASNRGGRPLRPLPGVHAISNRLLDTPWPKVLRGKRLLERSLALPEGPSVEGLMALLEDRTLPPDGDLPDTGMGLEWERILSPIFIRSRDYGTRSSTVVLIDREERVTFVERTHDQGLTGDRDVRFSFVLADPRPGAAHTP
jgi:uncharacterized protein with NRDE domain